MPLAADYPLLDVLLTMAVVVAGIIWIWLLIKVFADIIFRRHDASNWVKACWLIFVMVLPFLGVIVYLVAANRRTASQGVAQT